MGKCVEENLPKAPGEEPFGHARAKVAQVTEQVVSAKNRRRRTGAFWARPTGVGVLGLAALLFSQASCVPFWAPSPGANIKLEDDYVKVTPTDIRAGKVPPGSTIRVRSDGRTVEVRAKKIEYPIVITDGGHRIDVTEMDSIEVRKASLNTVLWVTTFAVLISAVVVLFVVGLYGLRGKGPF